MTTVDIAITSGSGGDTYLLSTAATNNYGASGNFQLDMNLVAVPLLKFDLSSIPAGSTCQACVLKLTTQNAETEETYNLYEIADANGDWIEGTKNGAQAGSGEPCWNAKAADGAGGVTTAWAGSAGMRTAGTDYVDTVIATVTTALDDEAQFDITFNAAGLAVVESWFGAASNNGVLLHAASTSTRGPFDSGESSDANARPILSVTYSASGIAIPVAQYYYNRLRRN